MKINACTAIHAEGRPTGGVGNTLWQHDPQLFRVTKLSLCHHCHLADGTFNSRDTLVHAISPNILTEVSKEVKKSEIALRY